MTRRSLDRANDRTPAAPSAVKLGERSERITSSLASCVLDGRETPRPAMRAWPYATARAENQEQTNKSTLRFGNFAESINKINDKSTRACRGTQGCIAVKT
jgi:hypothetical protein